ncbi:MAG: YbaB/EbfC family nucleoid-associated protein [Candidatus Roizmanbacteria bacterium]|nr:YbaB/EbfC family nucleoid-associated protein [Candidatus Roizmanbacteria bacterium]
MFNPLKGLGNLQQLQQQAKQMQQALQKEEVTIENNGVTITIRGDQRIINVEIDGVMENRVADAINDAVKKTQELAARKLMEMNQE